MTSPSGFSAQTLSVLAALCDQPSQWQHGYALAKQTGLKSGTLYPILIRLADQGMSFSSLVNDLRVELATRHVMECDRPLTEVAAMLAHHQLKDGICLPVTLDAEHDAFIGPLHGHRIASLY